MFGAALILAGGWASAGGTATEFCLDGEFDLGARLQGLSPGSGEWFATRWCVTSEDVGNRVQFAMQGHSNPDMSDQFVIAYLPPALVRLVNRDAPPDVEFDGAQAQHEAARVRRLDPHRLVDELAAHPQWVVARPGDNVQRVRYPGNRGTVDLKIVDGRLLWLGTYAEMPLRGRVLIEWRWHWREVDRPELRLSVDGRPLLRARGERRALSASEADQRWRLSDGQTPIKLAGERWPSRVDMQLERLSDGVYLVTGVRSGFHHLVVDTRDGLVIADAPAGWVELHQIPPADMVPGLGVSGLSEQLIDFLQERLPGRPIRAVALTHFHDDHAGGARAFAAAGGRVYAPAAERRFLRKALNRRNMPQDRHSAKQGKLDVVPVSDRLTLADPEQPVVLLELPPSPHVKAALAVWLPAAGYLYQSDLHVSRSQAPEPSGERAGTECWFAGWAVANLPSDAVVLSSHTLVQTPLSRLQAYLDSDSCRLTAGNQRTDGSGSVN